MATPTPGHVAAMTPEQLQAYRWEKEIDERNRPYTDEELDAMFPAGYKVLPPPAGTYPHIRDSNANFVPCLFYKFVR